MVVCACVCVVGLTSVVGVAREERMVWCLSSRGGVFFGAILGLFWEGEYWVRGGEFSCPGRGEGGGGAAAAAEGRVRRAAWRLGG